MEKGQQQVGEDTQVYLTLAIVKFFVCLSVSSSFEVWSGGKKSLLRKRCGGREGEGRGEEQRAVEAEERSEEGIGSGGYANGGEGGDGFTSRFIDGCLVEWGGGAYLLLHLRLSVIPPVLSAGDLPRTRAVPTVPLPGHHPRVPHAGRRLRQPFLQRPAHDPFHTEPAESRRRRLAGARPGQLPGLLPFEGVLGRQVGGSKLASSVGVLLLLRRRRAASCQAGLRFLSAAGFLSLSPFGEYPFSLCAIGLVRSSNCDSGELNL